MEGLRWGFEAGIQRHLLKGQKVFKNYESATGEYEDKVAKAMQKRVSKRKSIDVGEWIDLDGADNWRDVSPENVGEQLTPVAEGDEAENEDDEPESGGDIGYAWCVATWRARIPR